jgi:hypothetical protein
VQQQAVSNSAEMISKKQCVGKVFKVYARTASCAENSNIFLIVVVRWLNLSDHKTFIDTLFGSFR